MRLSKDEQRALGFVLALIGLATIARVASLPEPLELSAGPRLNIDSLATASLQALEAERRSNEPLKPGEKIDPNTAPATELMRLPRVGKGMAERIVAEREKTRFGSLQDLRRVPGIGPATLERLAPHVSLPPGPAPDAASVRHGDTANPPTSLAASPRPRVAPSNSAQDERIALNSATEADLQKLPGIGPALAARIVAYRDSVGRFRSVEELENVRGIGPASMRRLASRLRL